MCEVYKYLRFREKKDSGERLPSETNGKAALTDLVAEAGADHSSYSLPLSSFPSFSLPISSTFLPFAYPFLTFLPLPSLIFLLPSLSLPLPSFIPSLPYGLPPLSPSRGSEECCKLPQQGPRRNPGLRRVFKTILTPENTSSDKKFSSVFCCRYFFVAAETSHTDRPDGATAGLPPRIRHLFHLHYSCAAGNDMFSLHGPQNVRLRGGMAPYIVHRCTLGPTARV